MVGLTSHRNFCLCSWSWRARTLGLLMNKLALSVYQLSMLCRLNTSSCVGNVSYNSATPLPSAHPSLLWAAEMPNALFPRIHCSWSSGCQLHTFDTGLDSRVKWKTSSHQFPAYCWQVLVLMTVSPWSGTSFLELRGRCGMTASNSFLDAGGVWWVWERQLNIMESKPFWVWKSWWLPQWASGLGVIP